MYSQFNEFIDKKRGSLMSIEAFVLESLREGVAAGMFLPGEEINEKELALALDTSRMPVRQAIAVLEAEGLLVRVPRRGTFVAEVDAESVEEIYAMRSELESLALRRAIPRMTDTDFSKLQPFTELQAVEIRSIREHVEMNHAFHHALYAPCGWQRLLRQIRQLRNCLGSHLIRRGKFSEAREEASLREHRELVDACKNRDVALADQLIRAHNDNAKKMFLQYHL